MTQEDKELLLQDLCARLPFKICANLPNHHLVSHKYIIHDINIQNGWTTGILDCLGRIQIYGAKVEDIKPYLRPMSSMTEEEKEELKTLFDAEEITSDSICYLEGGTLEEYLSHISFSLCSEIIDWLKSLKQRIGG